MKKAKYFRSYLILLIWAPVSFSLGFNEYLEGLYTNNKKKLVNTLKPSVDRLAEDAKIADKDELEKITELLFLHFLFTTTDAVDGQTGGILKIPYFWHWTTPNPRHAIIYKSTEKKLKDISSPLGYQNYKSYADIDRTPYIYLKNLFEEEPLFFHPGCGNFYTFGWCSEREMAFSCILDILGLKSKIKQEGIHVWTEVLLDGKYSIKIDNTFNGFQIDKIKISADKWKKDIGNGAQVDWYNKKAHSKSEVEKVKSIEVNKNAEKRIQGQINKWIKETAN